jgi:hypothetical protein
MLTSIVVCRRNNNAGRLWLLLAITSAATLTACANIPGGMNAAPKIIEADGTFYVACSGFITVYQPSRDVADSSQKTYEITFTDDYGKEQDLKRVKSYSVLRPDQNEAGSPPGTKQVLNYAMAAVANPANTTTKYSNGQPIIKGSIVYFGEKGDAGRARWQGPGKWEPVPCN